MNKVIVLLLGLSLLPFFAVAATAEISLEELFGKIGDQPGPFVVHLHCGDGKQTGELLKRAGKVVQGLDSDAENVAKARRNPTFREEYGKGRKTQRRRRKSGSKEEERRRQRQKRQKIAKAVYDEWKTGQWDTYEDYARHKNEYLPQDWPTLTASDVRRFLAAHRARLKRQGKWPPKRR